MHIWMLVFESKYTRKVGGLAEVPPLLGRALAEIGHDVTIFVPSHGYIGMYGDNLSLLAKYDTEYGEIFVYENRSLPVRHVIIGGGVLEDPEIYAADKILSKSKLWAIGLRLYAEQLLANGFIPDIIHCHDWHSLPPMVSLKALYDIKEKKRPKYYYQIHLLSKKKIRLNDITRDIGVSPEKAVLGKYGWKTISEYYEAGRSLVDRIAGLLSDKLLTVSRQYVKDIIKTLGWDLEDHVDYIPNASTWTYEEILKSVKEKHPELENILSRDMKNYRLIVRRYLELEALSKMPQNEPIIDIATFRSMLQDLDISPFKPGGKVEPFEKEGPLIIMTGRLSRQKGFDTLLKSFEEIIYRVPEARFLLLTIPVWGGEEIGKQLIEASILYRENLRVIIGKAPSIFHLAHLAADVMVAPSIYEPFGLMALEAMASGVPVVASYTGGLAETVIDITEHGVLGTGIHFTPGDPFELAVKLSDMILFMESGYYKPWTNEWRKIVERIHDERLSEILISNPDAPWTIRQSCMRRATEYNWRRSAEKALKIYMS